MSDFLKQFQKTTERCADPELIKRWEWEMRTSGDEKIKTQAAYAKRMATALQNTCKKFQHLAPEQELAFKAASSGMRKLAADLRLLSAWAKDYRVFCVAIMKKEHTDRLESIALIRWGDDLQAMEFELEVVCEFTSKRDDVALGQWLHSRGKYTHIATKYILPPFTTLGHLGEKTPRLNLAYAIEQAMRNRESHMSFDNECVWCSWSDYETYLAYRKEISKTTVRILSMATGQSPIGR